MDLLSDLVEEKDTKPEQASIPVPESKASKSLETLTLIGAFVGPSRLDSVLKFVTDVLEAKPNVGTMRRLTELLHGFSTGLKKNTGIDSLELVRYSQGVLGSNLSTMLRRQQALEEKAKRETYRPQNCLLLAPEPKRYYFEEYD